HNGMTVLHPAQAQVGFPAGNGTGRADIPVPSAHSISLLKRYFILVQEPLVASRGEHGLEKAPVIGAQPVLYLEVYKARGDIVRVAGTLVKHLDSTVHWRTNDLRVRIRSKESQYIGLIVDVASRFDELVVFTLQ